MHRVSVAYPCSAHSPTLGYWLRHFPSVDILNEPALAVRRGRAVLLSKRNASLEEHDFLDDILANFGVEVFQHPGLGHEQLVFEWCGGEAHE